MSNVPSEIFTVPFFINSIVRRMRNSDIRDNEIMNNTADENCAADTGMKEIGGEKSLDILEDENRRLLALMQTECETEEDLSNLADIVPGLVCMHKSLQNHFGVGFKKAYSSKVLEKHGVSDKQKGVEIIGEVFSVEVTADKPIEENNAVPATDSSYNKNDIKNYNDGVKKSAVISAETLRDEIIEVHTMGAEVAPVGSRAEQKPILRNAASADEESFHSTGSVTEDKTPEYRDQSSPFRIVPSSQVMIPELTSFTPATGCRDASDFIVRCFVARLRSGITVMKHGRTRFYSSHMRCVMVGFNSTFFNFFRILLTFIQFATFTELFTFTKTVDPCRGGRQTSRRERKRRK